MTERMQTDCGQKAELFAALTAAVVYISQTIIIIIIIILVTLIALIIIINVIMVCG